MVIWSWKKVQCAFLRHIPQCWQKIKALIPRAARCTRICHLRYRRVEREKLLRFRISLFSIDISHLKSLIVGFRVCWIRIWHVQRNKMNIYEKGCFTLVLTLVLLRSLSRQLVTIEKIWEYHKNQRHEISIICVFQMFLSTGSKMFKNGTLRLVGYFARVRLVGLTTKPSFKR